MAEISKVCQAIGEAKVSVIRNEELAVQLNQQEYFRSVLRSLRDYLKAYRTRTLALVYLVEKESCDVKRIQDSLASLLDGLKQDLDGDKVSAAEIVSTGIPICRSEREYNQRSYKSIISHSLDFPDEIVKDINRIDSDLEQLKLDNQRFDNLHGAGRSELWKLEDKVREVETLALKVIGKYSQYAHAIETNENVRQERARRLESHA